MRWLLDSGYSDHLINHEKYCSSIVLLNNLVDVNLPNDKKMQATKVGEVKINF